MELNALSNWWSYLCQHWKCGQLKKMCCSLLGLYQIVVIHLLVLKRCVVLCCSLLGLYQIVVIHLVVMHELFWSVKGRTIMGQALKMLHLVWRVAGQDAAVDETVGTIWQDSYSRSFLSGETWLLECVCGNSGYLQLTLGFQELIIEFLRWIMYLIGVCLTCYRKAWKAIFQPSSLSIVCGMSCTVVFGFVGVYVVFHWFLIL